MDFIRHSYHCKMRFWDGEHTRLVKVRWFRALETAETFPFLHSFGSLKTYARGYKNDQAGEDLREGTQYDKGGNPLGYLGINVFKPGPAYLDGGVWDRDPKCHTDAQGWCETCGVPLPEEPGLAVGGSAVFVAAAVVEGPAYLAVGGGAIFPADALMPKAKVATFAYGAVYDQAAQMKKARSLDCDVYDLPELSPELPKAKSWWGFGVGGTWTAVSLQKAKDMGASVGTAPTAGASLPKAKDFGAVVGTASAIPAGMPKAKDFGAAVGTAVTASASLPKGKAAPFTVLS